LRYLPSGLLATARNGVRQRVEREIPNAFVASSIVDRCVAIDLIVANQVTVLFVSLRERRMRALSLQIISIKHLVVFKALLPCAVN
jgi:hypothetical protein